MSAPEDTGMDRRLLLQALAMLAGGGAASAAVAQETAKPAPTGMTGGMSWHGLTPADMQGMPAPAKPIRIGMFVYPMMVLQDLVGPLTIFNILGCQIHLVGKTLAPCSTDVPIKVTPTTTIETCPKDLDVLFVPGGIMGTVECMTDQAILDFIADRGSRARYVTSVCTGALVLAAAGLLKGYKAATLWAVMDVLPVLGAIPTYERVVHDRNRMTGGGVTAGLDFALTLGALLRDEQSAKLAQLTVEYSPAPPFHAGTPKEAGPELLAVAKQSRVGMDAVALSTAKAAAARLKA